MKFGTSIIIVPTVVVVAGGAVVAVVAVPTGAVGSTPVTEVGADDVLDGVDVIEEEEGVASRIDGVVVVGTTAVVVGLKTSGTDVDGLTGIAVGLVLEEDSVLVEQAAVRRAMDKVATAALICRIDCGLSLG